MAEKKEQPYMCYFHDYVMDLDKTTPDPFVCFLEKFSPIMSYYLIWIIIFLTLIVIAFSLLLRKDYSWFMLNQAVFQLIFQVDRFLMFRRVRIDVSSEFTIYLYHIVKTHWSFVSLLLLVLSRFLALYFPNFYSRNVKSKTILPIILAWNFLFFVPFLIYGYVYYFTSFKRCLPEFPLNVCENVTKYYNYYAEDVDFTNFENYDADSYYFDKDFFDKNKIAIDKINYRACFDYKDCVIFRRNYLDFNINSDLNFMFDAVFIAITLLLSGSLFIILLKNFKFQIKNSSRKSIKTSLKIALMIFFQSWALGIIGFTQTKEIFGFLGFQQTLLYLGEFSPDFYLCYFLVDSLLILLMLNDYRTLVMTFPKRIYEITKKSTTSNRTAAENRTLY